jgi:hypothetical protein
MSAPLTNEQQDIRPSHFAQLGQPCCSRWGKSEIEWIALAYVQALANDGDTWKRLSREQTYALLTDEQKRHVHGMLTDDFDVYERWFEAVRDQITDACGALGVRGFWNEHRLNKLLSALQESQHEPR